MLTTKEAWQEIQNRVGEHLALSEAATDWLSRSALPDTPSINDQIQKLYREEQITEEQRNAMREYVKTWLGDPGDEEDYDWWNPPEVQTYDTYACGLWAASAAPMGKAELSIILMTLQILCEEVPA